MSDHFDELGNAHMVDVGAKPETHRVAVASARVRMSAETAARIRAGGVGKGDVLTVAQIAGIAGAKRTSELIPLCHPLPLDRVSVTFAVGADCVDVSARAECHARTGVEMEALTAAAVAALTIYDMCKGSDRGMVVERVQLEEKRGGRSGIWVRS